MDETKAGQEAGAARVTLVVLWADGTVQRFTDSIQRVAEMMADYSLALAPPDMRIEVDSAPQATRSDK